MKKLLSTAAVLMALSSPAYSQTDINQATTDYARELTGNVKLLDKWHGVLNKQHIISGEGKPTYETLQKVFRSVRGDYITDSKNYSKFYHSPDVFFDYWASPDEFNEHGGGDCEDWAISWYYAAREAGFKPEQLNIWVGWLPKKNNMQHAVLAVEVEGKEYVLDNYSNTIHKADDYMHKNFKLMYRFNETGWSTK